MAEYKQLPHEELLKYTYDHAAWYWLGMSFFERQDFINAARWLEKTMNDPGNEWAGKATLNLGLLHVGNMLPNASKDEALRLFEKNPNGVMSRLNAGFLYFNGTETKHNPAKGKELVESAINQLIKDDGNDNYLSQSECWDIGWMYYKENNPKAYKWFEKSIARCNVNYSSDRKLIELAKQCIETLHRDGVRPN